MGAYEPTQEAKYLFVKSVREELFYNQCTDLFAVCQYLGQILSIEVVIRGLLRAREIVDQNFQGAKLVVIESAMIAVTLYERKRWNVEGVDLLGSISFLDSNISGLHPLYIVVRP